MAFNGVRMTAALQAVLDALPDHGDRPHIRTAHDGPGGSLIRGRRWMERGEWRTVITTRRALIRPG